MRCALAISSGRLAKNGAKCARATAGGAIGRFDPCQVFLAALLHDEQAGAHFPADSSVSAGGEHVGKEGVRLGCRRNTRSENGPSLVGAW